MQSLSPFYVSKFEGQEMDASAPEFVILEPKYYAHINDDKGPEYWDEKAFEYDWDAH